MSRQVAARRTNGPGDDDGTAPILHVDMDAFFASVELLDHPELAGRPVAVAREGARSVVAAANYPARKYGVRSALPLARARALCRDLVVLPPRGELYRRYNRIVMDVFASVTPLVEPLSIDEAFLDVSGAGLLHGGAGSTAEWIRAEIRRCTGLTCSVGVAATKSVAKMASTLAKPDGLLIIPSSRTQEFLSPLPISALWGVGESTGEHLARLGISTIGELADTPEPVLRRAIGVAQAARMLDLARGVDPRPVRPLAVAREEKSVGAEVTFERDVETASMIERRILALAGDVARRLREAGLVARTVSVKLRTAEFRTLTRTRTLDRPTDVARLLSDTATSLYRESGVSGVPLRLIGVRAEQLRPASETIDVLWDETGRWRGAERAVDRIEERFGRATVRPASLLGRDRRGGHEEN